MALVCKRLRAACDAPELVRTVVFRNLSGTTPLREVVAVRLPALRQWLQRHASHVRSLELIPTSMDEIRQMQCCFGHNDDRVQLAALTVSCLEACAAVGQLEQLRAALFEPSAHLHWLLGLRRLEQLYVGTEETNVLHLWPRTQGLTCLRNLHLECGQLVLEPGAGLPPSITRLRLSAGVHQGAEVVAKQVNMEGLHETWG